MATGTLFSRIVHSERSRSRSRIEECPASFGQKRPRARPARVKTGLMPQPASRLEYSSSTSFLMAATRNSCLAATPFTGGSDSAKYPHANSSGLIGNSVSIWSDSNRCQSFFAAGGRATRRKETPMPQIAQYALAGNCHFCRLTKAFRRAARLPRHSSVSQPVRLALDGQFQTFVFLGAPVRMSPDRSRNITAPAARIAG